MNILCIFFTLFNVNARVSARENNVIKDEEQKNENSNNITDIPKKNYSKIVLPLIPTLMASGFVVKKLIDNKKYDQNIDEDNQRKVRGLPNPGNACYMISALQVLYDDKKFRENVLNSDLSGNNNEKMNSVRKIFQYLSGKLNLTNKDIYSLYEKLGYTGQQEDSLDCKGNIEELFDREKITNNTYKSRSVLMYYDIPKDISENVVLKNLVNKNDDPKSEEKTVIDVNIYRTQDENTGEVNKNSINIPVSLTFGNNSFELVSINTHLGTSSKSGHYISYVKKGNKWKKRDDDNVTTHKWNDIKNDIGKNCVFLRYEKIR